MRGLKTVVPTLLILAALGVALATLLSDHKSDYGEVPLPPGGTVELPEGGVEVFYTEAGQPAGNDLAAPLQFQVVPMSGGPALEKQPTTKSGDSETQVTRSESIGSIGSVAKIDVPSEGAYVITGGQTSSPGSTISFGADAFTAVGRKWKLLAGLIGAAVLIALIPVTGRRRGDSADSAWSSDARFPYASD